MEALVVVVVASEVVEVFEVVVEADAAAVVADKRCESYYENHRSTDMKSILANTKPGDRFPFCVRRRVQACLR